jgi:hypothetical protein
MTVFSAGAKALGVQVTSHRELCNNAEPKLFFS